jgi:hypothetical protein
MRAASQTRYARRLELPRQQQRSSPSSSPEERAAFCSQGDGKERPNDGTHVVHARTEGPRDGQRGDGFRRLLAGGDLPPPRARPPRERARARRLDDALRPARGVASRAPGRRGTDAAGGAARRLCLRRRPAQGSRRLLRAARRVPVRGRRGADAQARRTKGCSRHSRSAGAPVRARRAAGALERSSGRRGTASEEGERTRPALVGAESLAGPKAAPRPRRS